MVIILPSQVALKTEKVFQVGPVGEKGNARLNLGLEKVCITQLINITKLFRQAAQFCRVFMLQKETIRNFPVPASKKIPQFGAYKFLIWLTLVRYGGADLPVRHRHRAVVVPHWCRLASGRSGGGAVRLHMEIG